MPYDPDTMKTKLQAAFEKRYATEAEAIPDIAAAVASYFEAVILPGPGADANMLPGVMGTLVGMNDPDQFGPKLSAAVVTAGTAFTLLEAAIPNSPVVGSGPDYSQVLKDNAKDGVTHAAAAQAIADATEKATTLKDGWTHTKPVPGSVPEDWT